MNLDLIRNFAEAVELGSFAAVARARGTAPSSVSRGIAELEAELDVRLFQRSTRRLSLTEAGAAYHARVVPLLEELEHAREAARDLGATPRGVLRVACSPTFAQLQLVRWLPDLRRRYPELVVELVLDTAISDLVRERVDVAIRLGRVQAPALIVKRLTAMPRAIVASPKLLAEQKLAPADVERLPCLVFGMDGGAATWRFRDERSKVREHSPRAELVAADGVVLREAAVSGMGLALLPRWVCADELRSGALIDCFPRHDVTATDFDGAISAVYTSRSYLPLKIRAFVDYLGGLFEAGPPWERRPR